MSCNGGATPADIVRSGPVPLSIPDGDAHFNQWLTLPSPCLNPVIFFASATGGWFAVSELDPQLPGRSRAVGQAVRI